MGATDVATDRLGADLLDGECGKVDHNGGTDGIDDVNGFDDGSNRLLVRQEGNMMRMIVLEILTNVVLMVVIVVVIIMGGNDEVERIAIVGNVLLVYLADML